MSLDRTSAVALAVMAAVLGASSSTQAATPTPTPAVKACLAKHAQVTTSHNKPGSGLLGAVVRARFTGGNQVGLWFYSSAARARAVAVQAKPTSAAFHTSIGTIGSVFYTWDHKPSGAETRTVATCLKR
jgi:hypothetical protein